MEFFRIESRFQRLDAPQTSSSELELRLRAALYKNAADAWGGRWRGPFEGDDEEEKAASEALPGSPAFFDRIARGALDTETVTVLSATRNDGAGQALRTALYRTTDLAAPFPPVCLTPDSETVRSGALQAGLQRLAGRAVPVHAVDLLAVDANAMPEALRVITKAIASDRKSEEPGGWIVVLDPVYERRIAAWSDENFYGQIQIERSQPIDRISLRVEIEPGAGRLSARAETSLASLYLPVGARIPVQSGVDRLAADVATLQAVFERTLDGLGRRRPIEIHRSLSLNRLVQKLAGLAHEHETDSISKNEFVEQSLETLAELRREQPDAAAPVAEFIAAYADTHPFEPVPLPDDASFVETIGRPPAVQRIVGAPRPVVRNELASH